MSLECEVGFVDVFNPEEYKEKTKSIELDLSWFEYWADKCMPVVWKQVNECYTKIMSLWDVNVDDAHKYLNALNRISSNYIAPHKPTLHH